MADALMKYETIDSDQIDQIMEGKVPDALTAGQMMIVVHQQKADVASKTALQHHQHHKT